MQEFLKGPTLPLFMGPWSEAELQCAAHVMFPGAAQRVPELYPKWGGIPRDVLELADYPWHQDQLDRTISLCDPAAILQAARDIDTVSYDCHKLVHIQVNTVWAGVHARTSR